MTRRIRNLWVDDLRPPPHGWLWAKTSDEAITFLQTFDIDVMSLDHDLGGDDTTRPVVLWMCERAGAWPRELRVHTANPVGREWLEGMADRYGPGVSHASEPTPVLRYNPDPAPDSLFGDEPGVTPVYRYLWSGKPGPALVQPMVALVGDDGEVLLEATGGFQECEVVDDSGEQG